jgi:hypothetical protein
MSLPAELRNWVCCPTCGTHFMLKRLGRVGVPRSMYGKRRRTRDSDRIKCDACGIVFRSRQQIIWEAFGRGAPDDDLPF